MSRHLAIVLVLLPACVVNADKYPRPRDLTPGWQTPTLRILAIRAEPPEIAPGGSATLTYLAADPEDAIGGALWTACSPEETTPLGCAIDFSALDEDATPDELREAGVIGFEPGFPPVFEAPEDALDDVEEDQRPEGVQYTTQVVLLPPEGAEPDDEVDFGTFESGYKRVVVSEASTPNNNPTIAEFTVADVPVGEDEITEVEPGEELELGILIPDAAVETYEYINPDGQLEERVEEPFASWYATDGQGLEDTTLYPFTQADWVAPAESGVEGSWYVVVRDRRGGIAWTTRAWRTR